MNEIAVSLRNISKKYKLFNSPKERLFEALHPFNKKYHREFWALKDISLDIRKGQTVGFIGRNGSGKSTLLQVICSILQPTSGSVTVNGRISALLELGAGFNPEFTGRDNVYLNGALMGFSQKEMEERLPMIEKFADIGQFIDQPVKIYSSGMFVRLAFAAAINVDPDILVVDEALAVGDAKFQHKCYNKFHDFQKAGKTVVMVTHDMSAILRECDIAVQIENGEIIKQGDPTEVVNLYLELLALGKSTSQQKSLPYLSGPTKRSNIVSPIKNELRGLLEDFLNDATEIDKCSLRNSYNKNALRFGDRRAEIRDYLVVCNGKLDPVAIRFNDIVDIYLKVFFYEDVLSPHYGFAIYTIDGILVYGSNAPCFKKADIKAAEQKTFVVIKLSIRFSLNAGDYFIDLGVGENCDDSIVPIDRRCGIIHLFIEQSPQFSGVVELESNFAPVDITSRTI